MKQTRMAGMIDIIKLDSLSEVCEMDRNPDIGRRLDTFHPMVNGIFLRRLLGILSFQGERFPTMKAKDAPGRAEEQDLLWTSLNESADVLRDGPLELEALARWVRGTGDDRELGRLVQQAVGKQFDGSYAATQETWTAALTLGAALRLRNPLKILAWQLAGKTRKAKQLLASKVGGDLAGVHGTGVALHNIVKGLQRMRALYADTTVRSLHSIDAVTHKCLFAPETVLRQATSAGTLSGCSFEKGSLFVVALGEAQKGPGAEELVFMDKTWSRCPAERWVPALLEGVWKRAITPSDGIRY